MLGNPPTAENAVMEHKTDLYVHAGFMLSQHPLSLHLSCDLPLTVSYTVLYNFMRNTGSEEQLLKLYIHMYTHWFSAAALEVFEGSLFSF